MKRPDTDLSWPDERPELLPLLPFVHAIWADGVLSPRELAAATASIEEMSWLAAEAKATVLAWLEPDHPPTPSALRALGARIRAADLEDDVATASLTDLGLALWRASAGKQRPWSSEKAQAGLRGLEHSLGIHGTEVARSARGTPPPTPAAPAPAPSGFDGLALAEHLDGRLAEVRERARAALLDPALAIPPGLPLPEYRARVLEAVRYLAQNGLGSLAYPERFGGAASPAAAVAVFEMLAMGDLSVLVKVGVQFGLFGGSVLQLGTKRHHEAYLGAIGSLELPGCYAMTEVDHGSNVRALETTATYDAGADELAVHTPHDGAAKHYIGNAALHGRMAVVFARLVVAGEDHGVHALLVPIRDETGGTLPGVRIEDCGLKEGLNGVDNGMLWFDHVRVPRANLLDRFASIDDEGRYRSTIPSAGRRFFRMLRTLVVGRVSIATAAVSASKVGLTIAIRYAAERRQFGPEGGAECVILDYPLIQRALMPRLATTYALHFAVRGLQTDLEVPERAGSAELEVEAAGLKAYASEHCLETLQACREACGGWGDMAESRFAALKADTDVFTTFEGANFVLYQLVAKGLLSRFRDEMGDLTLRKALQYLGERAETALGQLNPVVTRRTDAGHLLDPDFHRAALAYREERLLRSAAQRIRARLDEGIDSFQAVTQVQDHLVTLARAHVERVLAESLQDAVARAPTPALSDGLAAVSALYALSRIEEDRGWFLESGYIEGNKARAVRERVAALCDEVRELSAPLVEGLGVPEGVLPEVARRRAT
ncbi:MAG TPA: acyl-CoA dehydrogenase [Longimicrobiales bacterium]|nr:acyl-CoA dehydrogenase [Longimicrobiales bacterium]